MYFFKDTYEECPYTKKPVLITVHIDADGGFDCSIECTEPEIACQHQSNCMYAHREMCWLAQNAFK